MPNSLNVEAKKVTVFIPNWNGMKWLNNYLRSLQKQHMSDFDILVVDNGSTDESVSFIKENYPHVAVICLSSNTVFANAANIGIENSTTPLSSLLRRRLSGLIHKTKSALSSG